MNGKDAIHTLSMYMCLCVCVYDEIVVRKKEWNLAICHMDRPKGHYCKWNKSDRRRQVTV